MNKTDYWKNFKLGKELDVSGRFIYNGLQSFHEMEHFAYEEEIFEFLYSISVGIERLLKVALILTEHNDAVDQKVFEKSLITHNHGELLKRIKNNHQTNFSKVHNEFLGLLSKFYKTYRYGRYDFESMVVNDWEKTEFIDFLNKYLSISIDITTPFSGTPNDTKIKKFIGKLVGKISADLYEIIWNEAHRLNIYTYEIRCPSKAFKIFIAKEYDFEKEDTLRRELLIYFLNSNNEGDQARFLRSIKPLNFDPALEGDYISCFDSNVKTIGIMDELECLYEDDVKDFKNRKDQLSAIGSEYLYYDPNEEE